MAMGRNRTTRRGFMIELASLAALAACSSEQRGSQQTSGGRTRSGGPNPDSRLDTSLHHAMPASSATPGVAMPPNVPFHTFDATLPPRLASPGQIHLTAKETPVRLSDSTVVSAWNPRGVGCLLPHDSSTAGHTAWYRQATKVAPFPQRWPRRGLSAAAPDARSPPRVARPGRRRARAWMASSVRAG